MRKFLDKIFGGLNMSWKNLIIFAVIMGIYTGLMAMLVPDGNSFHDIAVTPEWWVLPAIIVIVNCKTPLDAALKTFVFFLISQPLVYLVQVPFNEMGWRLFQYYPYWFKITLATFPGAFVGWYIKKDKWYSGLILSVMTVFLIIIALGYINGFQQHFPNHLVTVIYCLGIIPVFIFGIFKDKIPRIITAVISIVAIVVYFLGGFFVIPFETYRNNLEENYGVTCVGDPYITYFSGTGQGGVEVHKTEDGDCVLKLSGINSGKYEFTLTDDTEVEYDFTFSWDEESNTVLLKRK